MGAGFVFGLHHIKDNADSVFVVVSDQTLIGVGCVSPDHTVALSTRLRRLVWNALWENDLTGWLQGLIRILRQWASWLLRLAITDVVANFYVICGRSRPHVGHRCWRESNIALLRCNLAWM